MMPSNSNTSSETLPEWAVELMSIIPTLDRNELYKSPAVVNYSYVLTSIFQDSVYPEISLISADSLALYVPDNFFIKTNSRHRIFGVLTKPLLFHRLPYLIQVSTLDILYLILRRGPYDIVRIQCSADSDQLQGGTLMHAFISLLGIAIKSHSSESIIKRIVLLIGLIGAAGQCSSKDLKDFLSFLRYPSLYSTSLLQSLQLMVRRDVELLKAFPSYFFNFGGQSSCISSQYTSFPFPREYQFITWFRIENFDNIISKRNSRKNSLSDRIQHLFTWSTGNQKGVDLFIEEQKLAMTFSYGRSEPVHVICKNQLSRGVWYHIAVKHSKPRLSVFGRYELTIQLDHQIVYQDSVKYPNFVHGEPVDILCGHNFDGQICTMYFLNDSLSGPALETFGKIDSGKHFCDSSGTELNDTATDLITSFTGTDKKAAAISARMTTVFHPNRRDCDGHYFIDIHGSLHAASGPGVSTWCLSSVKDILVSLGGISSLLPLFPRLFIENEAKRMDEKGIGLGSSLGKFVDSDPEFSGCYLIDADSVHSLNSDRQEIASEGCLGILFAIIARCLSFDQANQIQMIALNGIEMIEYALRCIQPDVLNAEDENCILSLLQMRAAVANNPALDSKIVQRLLCNFNIWSKANYNLQGSLVSVLLALIQAQPEYFLNTVGIGGLLDGVRTFYVDNGDETVGDQDRNLQTHETISAQTLSEIASSPSIMELEAVGNYNSTSPTSDDTFTSNIKDLASTSMSPTKKFASIIRRNSSKLHAMSSFKMALSREISNDVLESSVTPNFSASISQGTEEGRYEDDTEIGGQLQSLSVDTSRPNCDSITLPVADYQDSIASPLGIKTSSRDEEDRDRNAYTTDKIEVSYIVPSSRVIITSDQRRYLRECVESMILYLAMFGASEKEVSPLLDLLATCKNKIVLNEIAQLLLCLVVDGGSKIISSITSITRGPEEFASFILFHIIHQSFEELRCSGIRLLTHYYSKLDLLPVSLNALSLKRNKESHLLRTIEKLSVSMSAGNNSQGMKRLQVCGGLALLGEIMISHCKNSTEVTYSALLEMLLTRQGTRSQVVIKDMDVSEQPNYSSSVDTAQLSQGSFKHSLPKSEYNGALLSASNLNAISGRDRKFTQRKVIFVAHYLSPDHVHDEGASVIDVAVLPMYLLLIPKLAQVTDDHIFSDLLALLKHSVGNREAFCETPLWHICMFELVAYILGRDHKPDESSNLRERNTKTVHILTSSEIYSCLIKWLDIEAYPQCQDLIASNTAENVNVVKDCNLEFQDNDSNTLDSSMDLRFAIGLKIYATLLLQCLERKNGWLEIDRTISQSFKSKSGFVVAQTVLSHVVSELTFSMKSKYKDLQKLIKSTNQSEQVLGLDKLENLLCVVLTSINFSLHDVACVTYSVPAEDLRIGRLRVHSYLDTADDFQQRSSIGSSSSSSTSVATTTTTSDGIDLEGTKDISNNVDVITTSFIEETAEINLIKFLASSVDESLGLSDSVSSNHLDVPSFSPDPSGSNTSYISLDHRWFDITSYDSVVNVRSHSSLQTTRQLSQSTDSHHISKSNPFERDHLLPPLERDCDKQRSSLVFVLQTLRLFDALFWPSQTGEIRNKKMLKYSDKSLHHEGNSLSQSSQARSPGNSSSTSSSTSSGSKKGSNPDGQIFTQRLSLFSSIMRISLFTLQTISPFTVPALMNVNRMKAVLDCSDSVSFNSTPVFDWILVVLFHLTLSIQRLSHALMPVYNLLGIVIAMEIPSVGVLNSNWDFDEHNRIALDGELLEGLLKQKHNASNRLLVLLRGIFDNPAGRQLLSFIKAVMLQLYEFSERYQSTILRALDGRNSKWFAHFIERYRDDLTWKYVTSKVDSATAIDANTSGESQVPPKTHNAPSQSPSALNQSIEPIVSISGTLTSKRQSTESFDASLSSLNMDTGISAGGGISPTSSESRNRKQSEGIMFIRGWRSGAATLNDDELNRNWLDSQDANGEFASHNRTKKRSHSISSEISDASSDQRDSFEGEPPTDQHASIAQFDKEMIMVLIWLREPYFRCNLFRSIGLMKSVIALDNHESICMHNFSQDLGILLSSLNESRDQAAQVTGEIMELKELALNVHTMMSNRELNRRNGEQALETLRLKRIATSWQDCINTYDMDWSVWSDPGNLDSSSGRSYYEMSKLKDTRMRRMILTRLPEPTDHVDAAYLEAKLRDQIEFEAAMKRKEMGLPVALESSKGSNRVESSGDFSTGANRSVETLSFLNHRDGASKLFGKVAGSGSGAIGGDQGDDEDDNGSDEELVPATVTSTVGLSGINQFFSQQNFDRPMWSTVFKWEPDEKIQILLEATQIQVEFVISGVLLLTNKFLYFHPVKQTGGLSISGKAFNDSRWHLDRLIEIHGKRYLLQNCAFELYFIDNSDVFFALKSRLDLKTFFRVLKRQHIPLLTSMPSMNITRKTISFSQCPWTDLWRKRQISNFEYLMRLNIMAGRSYNDITQYPVFPWIIADYNSPTLDLENPQTFRDLKKPVGALNGPRLQEFLDRYRTFDDEEVPKFMYGSHYSSAGVVMHYLIRQEPFTTLAINLQGGRFDCPDRMFFDIKKTWQGCNSSMSDVKELIPELFCCPEALINSNRLPLGELQEGGEVDDIVLPPWASSAYEFVRLNREALESDYVSDRLNDWIDLIFGYKQIGQAAIDSFNVFYYLTYENAINIDAITDPLQKEATKAQVTHFGQTPSQLFTKEHPKRLHRSECMTPLFSDIRSLNKVGIFTPKVSIEASQLLHGAVVAIHCSSDKLVVCHADLTIGYYRWNSFPDELDNMPFQIKRDRLKTLPSFGISLLSKSKSSDRLGFVRTESSGIGINNSLSSGSASPDDTSAEGPTSAIPASSGDEPETISPVLNKTLSQTVFSVLRRGLNVGTNSQPVQSPKTSPNKTFPGKSQPRHESFGHSASSKGDRDQQLFSDLLAEGDLNESGPTPNKSWVPSHMNVALTLGDTGSGRIISCGYWDNTVKVHSLDNLKDIVSARSCHMGAVTCLQIGYQAGLTAVTGGDDGVCRVWIVENPLLAMSYNSDAPLDDLDVHSSEAQFQCVRLLLGHSSPITAISFAPDLDIIMSASTSGLICLHTARQGLYIRSIKHLIGQHIDLVLVSSAGYLVVYSKLSKELNLFWINGQHLTSQTLSQNVEVMAVNGPGSVLVCGMDDGSISLRALWNLDEIHTRNDLKPHGCIKSLWFTEDLQYLMIGSEDGTFSIANNPEIRWKVIHSAIQNTPLLGSAM